MGNRRMFSRRITDSARFLKMGSGAQLLYFHLCMHADDDGVVEAFTVRRGIGANDDDMSNLVGRKFIKVLDAENEIVLITDWYEHNKIRRDRITPSIYRDLIEEEAPEVPLLEPTQRKDRPKSEKPSHGQPVDGHGTDSGTSQGQPTDGQVPDSGTTMGPPKISKDKLSKVKLRQVKTSEENEGENNGSHEPTNRKRFSPPSISEIEEYCREKGYNHVDAEYFWNYYENINWHVGKNKMKSWKLAVANWEKRQIEYQAEKGHGRSEIIQHDEEQEEAPLWAFQEQTL